MSAAPSPILRRAHSTNSAHSVQALLSTPDTSSNDPSSPAFENKQKDSTESGGETGICLPIYLGEQNETEGGTQTNTNSGTDNEAGSSAFTAPDDHADSVSGTLHAHKEDFVRMLPPEFRANAYPRLKKLFDEQRLELAQANVVNSELEEALSSAERRCEDMADLLRYEEFERKLMETKARMAEQQRDISEGVANKLRAQLYGALDKIERLKAEKEIWRESSNSQSSTIERLMNEQNKLKHETHSKIPGDSEGLESSETRLQELKNKFLTRSEATS